MAKDMDPHILNFYEDYGMPLSDVPDLIRDALVRGLDDPREKLDGQNFTFTVVPPGHLRFMGKGCSKWIREQGGLTRSQMRELYEAKPQVLQAFTEAFDVLQGIINQMPYGTIAPLFREGEGIVSAEVVTPINQNIVRYIQNAVCFIEWRILGWPPSHDSMHSRAFQEFCENAGRLSPFAGWTVTEVPRIVIQPLANAEALTRDLTEEFRGLARARNMGPNSTMGDLLTAMVQVELGQRVPSLGALTRRAARRLATDDASALRRNDFPSAALWASFKPYDDERAAHVGEWTLPVETFFRKLGMLAIESHRFTLADVADPTRIDEMQRFVRRVRDAVGRKRVRAPTPEIMARIESALRRVDEGQFTRNVEGIVFRWKGRSRKLTGAFTAINRLHGFFNFDNPARIDE